MLRNDWKAARLLGTRLLALWVVRGAAGVSEIERRIQPISATPSNLTR